MFACIVMLSSCKKEDKVNAPNSLTGTSWIYETVVEGVPSAVELDFTSATKGEINVFASGKANDVIVIAGMQAGEFTSTYNKPNVAITFDGETVNGKIDGDKLILENIPFTKE